MTFQLNPFANEERALHLISKDSKLRPAYYLRIVTAILDLVGIITGGVLCHALTKPENWSDFGNDVLVAALPLPATTWSFLHCLLNLFFIYFCKSPLHPGWNIGLDICIIGYMVSSATFMGMLIVYHNGGLEALSAIVTAVCSINSITHIAMFIMACISVHRLRIGQKTEIIELRNQLAHERARNSEADDFKSSEDRRRASSGAATAAVNAV